MFLQDVPLTGIAFCYAPLLLTVLGFIIFAAMTDLDARRTYLRRALGKVVPPAQPMLVETPSRAEVVLVPPMGGSAVAAPVVEAPPAVAKSAPKPVVDPAVESAEDDLQRIEGIGPKVEGALKESGIKTFAQVAAMSADDLTRIVKEEKGVRIVGDAATWAKQAQFLVDGDEAGFEAYKDRLVGGREPDA